MQSFLVIKIFAILIISLRASHGLDREMTIVVNAKEMECFYETVAQNHVIDFEYQVIDGGQGDLDINFELSHNGRIIFVDYKKSDNVHRVEKAQGGEYKFCFDNTISHFNSKTVFFELIIEDPSNPQDENDAIFSDMEGLSPEEFYEMKVQDINDIIQSVKNRMGKARQLQDMLRSFEARDRNLAEMNNSRVNLFSVFIIVTMVCVGIIQVFMIRSLFETDPKQKRVWEKISKLIESFQ